MWKNYIKMTWRNLLRNRGYAVINILGLAIGLACFLFIWLYVRHEWSYDRWHEKGERIYRLALERKYPGRSRHYAITPEGYAQALKKDLPEIEESCRLFAFDGFGYVIKKADEVYKENEVLWADTSFFELFDIPLLKGDKRRALAKPFTAVLTQSLARKYFGDQDPIGQVLELPEVEEVNGLEITGVCADAPENTHLRFSMLVSSNSLDFIQESTEANFINFSAYNYFLLREGTSPEVVERKLPDLVVQYASGQVLNRYGVNYEEYQKQGNGYHYALQSLQNIYLDSRLEGEIKPPGSRQRLYFFSLIALLILAIASINFMNLATARSATRAKEVGVRKTLGASRREVMLQFILEAVVIGLVSGVLAYAINWLLLGQFNVMTGKTIGVEVLLSGSYVGILLAAALATGFLSGIYPALALSLFRPVDVLKGKLIPALKGKGLRNALAGFQFAISVFLIACTIIVYRQLAYTQNKGLGFDRERVISLEGGDNMTAQESEIFKRALASLPGIVAVSGCSAQPGADYFGISFKPSAAEETTTGSGLIVDEGYLECLAIKVLEGRSFSEEFADSLSIIVNQAAAREMNLSLAEAVGTRLSSPDDFLNPTPGESTGYTIIGVVEDFHFQSLHHPIGSLFLVNNQSNFTPGVDNLITARLEGGTVSATLKEVESLWQSMQPTQPFLYSFLDQDWAELYDKEMMARRAFGLFSLLAIFIACLGLLALAAFTVERRTKEIGIRKVLGATASGIVGLLSRDFLRLVLGAIAVATPLAWYFMKQWLDDFAYRTNLAWWVFALAGGIALLIAFLAVSIHSVRAAFSSPVEALKSE